MYLFTFFYSAILNLSSFPIAFLLFRVPLILLSWEGLFCGLSLSLSRSLALSLSLSLSLPLSLYLSLSFSLSHTYVIFSTQTRRVLRLRQGQSIKETTMMIQSAHKKINFPAGSDP